MNQELTWLNFNFRVLSEAEDDRVPLLERVKFIAIVSANIDEFFMMRIGGLKQQHRAGIQHRTIDGRTSEDRPDPCRSLVRRHLIALPKEVTPQQCISTLRGRNEAPCVAAEYRNLKLRKSIPPL